uniref:Uncharacterized protein n=1 Tax=Talaromyces marneffei PM1 TaxID=1077442 RepID=A0A093VY60_TALMA
MANLEQFNKDQEELLKRLDFDIPAVREAEKSGLSVVLMDPPSKIRVTPSAVRTVWFAIHGRDGACDRSLSLRGGNPWPSGYPIPVQDEDKIRKRILELESKTHLID